MDIITLTATTQNRVDEYNNIISYYTQTLFKSLLFIVNLISLPDMLMSSPVLYAKTKNSLEFMYNFTKLELTTLLDVMPHGADNFPLTHETMSPPH